MPANLRILAIVVLALVVGVVAACGGDDDELTTASSGQSHTEVSSDVLETWQTQLNSVGCWAGDVDGQLGPETEAAIKEFQATAGLTVDGLLGPDTEAALNDAADAGETVCTGDGGGETSGAGETSAGSGSASATGPAAMLSGELVARDFIVESCENQGETDLVLVAKGDAFVLNVEAPDERGTIAYSGGDEQDSIDLTGSVASVTVGDDGTFTVQGAWESGEAYTLSGTCPS